MKVYPMQALPFTMQLSALCTQASPRTRHNKATERAIFPKTHTAVVPRKQGTVPRRQHESRTIHPAYMQCELRPQALCLGTSAPGASYNIRVWYQCTCWAVWSVARALGGSMRI
jgi:hypothetical protein